MNKVIIQGGGEHARVVLDCLQAQGLQVVALFDPKYTGDLWGVPQRGAYDPAFMPEARAIVAIGNNAVRKRVVSITQHEYTNAVHPSAIISSRSSWGTGNMILHGVIIQAQAHMGNHCILNTGVRVDHDCIISDYVHIAPGTVLCGTVTVGEGTFIGAGAVVIPGRKVGAWATVGAGAVVTRDIPDYAVAVGNPARIIKYTNIS
ncbi:acetyltransferase [Dawidia soli]|uniref:Acetyltransferase n=1 Tax=Dawidia soli TaxID=2782352 RepID=A0AAP2DA91_9BACT|nr:acetyltransferase [Dawidia soli]MBT1688318.1 acetyltransferase [Dawidia soli]